jgi:hypothetical protein
VSITRYRLDAWGHDLGTAKDANGDLVYFADHEAEVSALRAQLAAAEARAKRYETALRRIANEDYRGNRPPSAVLAHETLEGGAE